MDDLVNSLICREGVARPEYQRIYPIFHQNAKRMINDSNLHRRRRLRQKQLDQLFKRRIIEGMNCSPFEAEAILETVHSVYGAFFKNSPTSRPGQLRTHVVSIEAGPVSPLSECPLTEVTLTIDAGEEDLAVRTSPGGITALRRHRLQRICNEAFQQGGLLVAEDIAYTLFNCGLRTLSRDLAALAEQGISPPMRSTIKDMGRRLSHRTLIVKAWLSGAEYTAIARRTNHSVSSVSNYVDKFRRCVMLHLEGIGTTDISTLVRLSPSLVTEYVGLWEKGDINSARLKHLRGSMSTGKKNPSLKKKRI